MDASDPPATACPVGTGRRGSDSRTGAGAGQDREGVKAGRTGGDRQQRRAACTAQRGAGPLPTPNRKAPQTPLASPAAALRADSCDCPCRIARAGRERPFRGWIQPGSGRNRGSVRESGNNGRPAKFAGPRAAARDQDRNIQSGITVCVPARPAPSRSRPCADGDPARSCISRASSTWRDMRAATFARTSGASSATRRSRSRASACGCHAASWCASTSSARAQT